MFRGSETGTQLLLFSPSLAVLSGTAFPHGLPDGVTRIFPLSVADQQQADTMKPPQSTLSRPIPFLKAQGRQSRACPESESMC